MKCDNLPTFEKYLRSTPVAKLSSIYLILGKETNERQEALDLLLSILIPSNQSREFALTMFDGGNIDEAKLNDALYSNSFFSKSQVICIQNFEKPKKSIQEKLEKAFSHPQPSRILIVEGSSLSKTASLYQTVEQSGVLLDLVEAKPWEKEKRTIAWINKYLAAEKKVVSYQGSQLIVKRVGHDYSLLTQELEKLMCYCGEKNEITVQDIDLLCPYGHFDSIWQFGEAIFFRRTKEAMQIGKGLLESGNPFLPLLRQIRFQFQTEYQVSLLLSQGKESQEITKQFPYMKGQVLERHLEQVRHYGCSAFKEGLLAIDEMEMRAKNSSVDEKILLELLIYTLTFRSHS